jgi:uncharacterized membrane protein
MKSFQVLEDTKIILYAANLARYRCWKRFESDLLQQRGVWLFLLVVCLYFTLVYVMSVLSLSLTHYDSSSRLQYLAYNSSASVFSLLLNNIISDLTISEFILQTMNLRKQIK